MDAAACWLFDQWDVLAFTQQSLFAWRRKLGFNPRKRMDVKLIGWSLLLSGWFIVLAALEMLPAGPLRVAFLVAGGIVEGLGLVVLCYGYTVEQRRSE